MPPSGPSTPTGPSSSTSTPLKKVPPTGPKAQGQSFAGLPTGPRAQPVAIPFGGGKGRKTFGQGQSQSSSGTNLNTNSNYNRSPYPQSTYQYGSGYDQSSSPHHGTSYGNGGYDYSGPSSHAESSRQALAKSIPTGPSGPRDKKQKAAVTSTREVGIPSVPGSGLGSGSQSKDSNGEGAYGSTLLHTEQSRTPIKIAFPTFQTTTSSKSAPKAKTKSTPHPPPPPDDRPPTPPLGDGPPPPPPPDEGPPPPPDMAPPPSPSPSPKKKSLPLPRRSSPIRLPAPSAPSGPVIRSQTPPTPPPRRSSPIRLPAPPGAVYPTNTSTSRNQRSPTPPPRRSSPIRLPPPPTASLSDATASHSKLPPTPPPQPQPVKFSIPTQTQKSALAKDAPPSFHFRNIPVRRSPSPTKSSAGSLAREPTPPPREATPRAPTPPPYIPEPYIAPASVVQRAGLGNFRITHDPALEGKKDKGKEVKRRFDGEGLDKVEDPRLALPVEMQKRGRGTAKQRTEFHEIEYSVSHTHLHEGRGTDNQWDNNSVGRKPLPLPCAVLLTGLNPLTTTDQISQYLRPHGRIREMDSRMDTKSGMQLGICWVKFDTPSSASGKSAHEIANTVVKVCNGQRIRMQGDEKIKVVLDGRGLRAQKAVKEEMERRYKPKPKPVPKAVPKAAPPPPPMPTPAPTAPTPASTHEAGTPKSDPHTNSNGSLAKPKPSHALHALPSRPIPHAVPLYANNTNRNYASLGRSQPVRPPMPNFPPSRPTTMPTQAANPIFFKKQYTRGDRDIDLRDNFSPRRERSRSRSRDRDRDRSRDRGRGRDTYIAKSPSRSRRRSYSRDSTHSTDCPTCPSNYSSDSGDERHYRPTYRRRSPGPRRIVGRAPVGPSKEDEAAMEKVKIALAQNGRSHIYIDETSLSTRDTSMSEYLRDHFRAFHPKQVSYFQTERKEESRLMIDPVESERVVHSIR
jgi:histone-lysine N-methyltransferase SETD1